MKLTKAQLKKIILEEVAVVLSGQPQASSLFRDLMGQYIGSIRGNQLWFHGAHNVAKGVGFSGDHPNLFGEIYGALEGQYDEAVEKAIGNSGDEMMGCPSCNTKKAMEVIQSYESPANANAEVIVQTGLQMLKDHHQLMTDVFDQLEEAGELPLGVNDMLAAHANDIETFIYLIQQRAKV
jgi:hypothetical protein